MANNKKRRWLKWVLAALILLVLAAGVLALLAGPVIAPAIIRSQASAALADYWDGELAIGEVDFRWRGPIRLGGIRLTDGKGRPWCEINGATFTLADWPSTSPVLTDVDVDGLTIIAHADGAELDLPLKPPPPDEPADPNAPSAAGKYVDLRSVTIRNMRVKVDNADGPSPELRDVVISLKKTDGGGYTYSLESGTKTAPGPLALSGTADADGNVDGAGALNCSLAHADVEAILKALGVTAVRSGSGDLDVRLKYSGPLAEPRRIRPKGTVRLTGADVQMPGGELARNVSLVANVNGHDVGVQSLRGDVADGVLKAQGLLRFEPNRPPRYSGQLLVSRVDLRTLVKAFGAGSEDTRGVLAGRYTFEAGGVRFEDLTGSGSVFLDDAAVLRIPVISQIFDFMDLGKSGQADLTGNFTNTGPVVRLGKETRLSSMLIAMEAQPGGTINLRTEQLDLHVYGVPVNKETRQILDLPLLNLGSGIARNMIRLRVKGHWHDPPENLISKEPVGDLTDASREFFRGAIQTPGQIGEGVMKGFGDLMKMLED